MQLINRNNSFHYEMENLIRVFLPEIKIIRQDEVSEDEDYCLFSLDGSRIDIKLSLEGKIYEVSESFLLADKVFSESDDSFFERKMAVMLFDLLGDITGYAPPWGILTGVRPAKLMTKLREKQGEEKAVDYFINELKVSEDKTALALMVSKNETPIIEGSKPDSFSLYVSVPFCPTRCSYCSFISHSNESAKKLIPAYVEKLCEEIKITGEIAREQNLTLESVYIGGGTPTVLTAEQLKRVTDEIADNFDLSGICEYTIEAGRPDSITEEKFLVMKNSACTRISINPQTFSDSVLKEIGRNHTSEETLSAFTLAREKGFGNINMDLIAGLPTDTLESFSDTLDTAISLKPENITVHTLALKRSSTIVTEGKRTNSALLTKEMLSLVQKKLTSAGYEPYYMYRQSKSLGNLENVGWAKKGFEGIYNVYMMEECHTILSVGAGAVIKLKAPHGSEIERIYNYKYPYEYIGNFEEIISRKKYIGEFYTKFPI
ncbi:MAG: coproporphyrinogen dehydrogenase HemZ [Clostridia bacterium]|nr:coproporphyrinogen dehydrogenase HemZ [Clostridia bacterium]